MCLGMNEDQLSSKERCASTSIETLRVDKEGAEAHLVSPGMAIAAAINGKLSDVREIN